MVLKTRFPVNERSAFGLELAIGADFASAYHLDLNYTVSRLGAIGPTEGRLQELWAAALSKGIDERRGVVGEFSGTHQSGAERTAQALLAASFMPAHNISWDFGVARGLTAATPSWSLFAGVTFLNHLF